MNIDLLLSAPLTDADGEAAAAARRAEALALRDVRMSVDVSTVPITGELHKWQTQTSPGKGYIALWGYIYGDVASRFRDGTWIRTSMIVKIEDGIALTLNSAYRLVGDENKVQQNDH